MVAGTNGVRGIFLGIFSCCTYSAHIKHRIAISSTPCINCQFARMRRTTRLDPPCNSVHTHTLPTAMDPYPALFARFIASRLRQAILSPLKVSLGTLDTSKEGPKPLLKLLIPLSQIKLCFSFHQGGRSASLPSLLSSP